MNDLVIIEMKKAVNDLVERVKNDVGDHLLFERVGGYYDRPKSSYTEVINAFGYEFSVVYVFEEQMIYLYDTTEDKDIMKCTALNTNGGVIPLYDFMLACEHYFYIVHMADSVGYISLM